MTEIEAINACYEALEPLTPEARERVMTYLNDRLMKDHVDKAAAVLLMLNSAGKLREVLEASPEPLTIVKDGGQR